MSRLVLLLLSVVAAYANAQSFPVAGQPVSIVVPYPPGGLGDILSRLVGSKMQESLGVPVVVENKPGANGGIGTAYGARPPPDGPTLAIGAKSAGTHKPPLYPDPQNP